MLNKCPDDCKSQLEALVSATKKNVKSNTESIGTIVDLPAGRLVGAVQAGNGIFTGLSKGCHNGNLIENVLDVADSGVKGYGRGFADGSVNGYASFGKFGCQLGNL